MAASRASKVRRLVANARVPHSVLSDIVSQLRDCPELLEEELSRFSIGRAVEALWSAAGCTQKVKLTTGGTFDWDCLSLPKVLQHLSKNCAAFRAALRETWEAHPCTADTPWHLVAYGDEVVPGNVLRLDNRRKFFGLYITIREFGGALIKHETLWIALAMIRSSIAKQWPGGLSGWMSAIFHKWFLDDKVRSDGILLDLDILGSRFVRVFLKLGNMVADGDAYRAIWSAKGASGKVPCLMCKNVISDRTSSRYLVHLSCPFAERFDLMSNEEIWEKADKVSASREVSNKSTHEALQRTLGLTDNPDGVLWNKPLRQFVLPVDVITFDNMHCLVSGGIAQNEVSLLLSCLQSHGVTWKHLRTFVSSDWHMCSALGSHTMLKDCFAVPRETAFKKESGFKAMASEMLLVCPVLQYFLHKVVGRNKMPEQIDSFDQLCHVLRLVGHIKLGCAAAGPLADALRSHALAFAKAYPEAEFKPKNHYIHHVPGQVRRDAVLLDCFVGERKHGSLKLHADCVKNTQRFEHSVLLRALSAQVSKLEEPTALSDRLTNPIDSPHLAAEAGCQVASVAHGFTWSGTRIRAGDCIRIDEVVHIVVAGACLDGGLFVLGHRHVCLGEARNL